MSIKRDIVGGVRFFWMILFVLCVILCARILQYQFSDMSELSVKATKVELSEEKFLAPRGQIYDSKGHVLACSLSFFDLYLDCVVAPDSVFKADVGTLAKELSKLYGDKTPQEYKKSLKFARARGRRYYHIGNRKLTYIEAQRVREFPILKRGGNRGGLILKREVLRSNPFGALAERTIGKLSKNEKGDRVGLVGLEEAYESELRGVEGLKKIERAARYRIDYVEREAVAGNDIHTTLDIDIQDLAEKSLLWSLQSFQAEHGTVVVMEVKTGEIKAMVNLGRGSDGEYYEKRNYAIEDLVEPGSVWKLASMISLFEDGKVALTDSVHTGNGVKRFHNAKMRDAHACGTITVQQVFEKSSNVGTSILVYDAYKSDPQKYIDRLYDLHLGDLLHLEIGNEAKPRIKEPSSDTWWGTSLPWMSIGYEVLVTPMHILALYNAVANEGVMVKPKIVTAVKRGKQVIRDFSAPQIIDNNICSNRTIQKLRLMMEGVVERGTASNIKDERYKIAGKTGTAHIANPNGGYDTQNYRSTFAGYFPADKPKYSCIVVVEKPDRKIGRYGGTVAAPVVKKIADGLYSKGLITEPAQLDSVVNKLKLNMKFVKTITKNANLQATLGVKDMPKAKGLEEKGKMPQLVGMSLRDAVFILEKVGLKVQIKGTGTVTEQSVPYGKRFVKGETITLYLS